MKGCGYGWVVVRVSKMIDFLPGCEGKLCSGMEMRKLCNCFFLFVYLCVSDAGKIFLVPLIDMN